MANAPPTTRPRTSSFSWKVFTPRRKRTQSRAASPESPRRSQAPAPVLPPLPPLRPLAVRSASYSYPSPSAHRQPPLPLKAPALGKIAGSSASRPQTAPSASTAVNDPFLIRPSASRRPVRPRGPAHATPPRPSHPGPVDPSVVQALEFMPAVPASVLPGLFRSTHPYAAPSEADVAMLMDDYTITACALPTPPLPGKSPERRTWNGTDDDTPYDRTLLRSASSSHGLTPTRSPRRRGFLPRAADQTALIHALRAAELAGDDDDDDDEMMEDLDSLDAILADYGEDAYGGIALPSPPRALPALVADRASPHIVVTDVDRSWPATPDALHFPVLTTPKKAATAGTPEIGFGDILDEFPSLPSSPMILPQPDRVVHQIKRPVVARYKTWAHIGDEAAGTPSRRY